MVTNRKIATIPTWRVDIGRIRLFATHLTMGAKGKETDMTDDFATYQDYLEMADDRDDRDDIPSYGESYDYCPHGVYVGGCGIDWMCQWCEDGISVQEARRIVTNRRTKLIRTNSDNAQNVLNVMLMHGIPGMKAAKFAQDSSYVGNPRSRYGRH